MFHSWNDRSSQLWEKAATTWCRVMHPAPMWPVNGQYRCPECLRTYAVPWEEQRKPVHSVTQLPVRVTAQPAGQPPLGRAA